MLTSKAPACNAEQGTDYVIPIRANTEYVLAQNCDGNSWRDRTSCFAEEPNQSRIDLVAISAGNVVRAALDPDTRAVGDCAHVSLASLVLVGPTYHNADNIAQQDEAVISSQT